MKKSKTTSTNKQVQVLQQRIARETAQCQVLRQRVQTLQDLNWQQAEATGRFVAENGILEIMLEQLQQAVEAVDDMESSNDSPESSSLGINLIPKQALCDSTARFKTHVSQQEAKKQMTEGTQNQHGVNAAPATTDEEPRAAPSRQPTKRKSHQSTNDSIETASSNPPPSTIKKINLWSSKTHFVYKCPLPDCNRQIPFCKAADATPPLLPRGGGVSDQVVWSTDYFAKQIHAARKHMRTKHPNIMVEHWPPGFGMQPQPHKNNDRAVPQQQQQQGGTAVRGKVLAKYPPQKENDSLETNSPPRNVQNKAL